MRSLTRTGIHFQDIEDLIKECVDLIDDHDDPFNGYMVSKDLILLIEDLRRLSIKEAVEFLVGIIEAASCGSEFVGACYEQWEFSDPDFCEEVRDVMDYEI